jgi:hypothetical protein
MPGVCPHEFFWPQKATNGRYYQSCRLCGSVYEYDWRNMGRLETQRMVDAEKAASSERAGANTRCEDPAVPRLLVELEPAHRVFLQNLTDTLQALPDAATLRQWSFWRKILVNSGMPWRRFGESIVLQVIAIAILIVAQTWIIQDLPRRRSVFDTSVITYYKPDAAFPALRGNPGKVHPTVGKKTQTASRGSSQVPSERPSERPIRVKPETTQAALTAPVIRLNGPARPSLMGSNLVPPVMPLASIGHARLTVPAGLTSIVAPPPELGQGAIGQGVSTSRQLGLAQASVVAPAPELGLGASSGRSGMSIPSATVIGPAPMVQAGMHKTGEFNIGPSAVVAPSPKLPMGEQRTISSSGQASFGSLLGLAVPPTPSASGSGTLAGGRMGPLSGGGSQVVPPPPSIQGVSGVAGGGQSASLSGSGLQVVPPAPSLQGAGDSGTDRRGGSLSNAGLQGVAPAPSVGAGGNSGRGGRQLAMNVAPSLAAAPVIANAHPQTAAKEPEAKSEPPTEEMPLRLIGLAMALPNSSYFSNYEVYIAERKLRKNLTELVKLVYVYLPYQRRLSEYGVDQSKVFKLLVSRDRTCDESLMQMTWPETDRPPDAHNATDAPGLSAADKKSMLPCYRTTADDYRKAMARR